MTPLYSNSTALVLIDLQQGILGMQLAPRSGADVLANSIAVAQRFRNAKAPIVLVRTSFVSDFADAPPRNVDQPMQGPTGGLPTPWGTLAPALVQSGDIVVTKRNWGAFHGTDLDLQLRRRSIKTIVLSGIATNFGVESTARCAWELNYDLVVLEDLCTSGSAELHSMAISHVLPRISRVIDSTQLEILS